MTRLIVSFCILITLLPIALAESKIFSGKVITNTDKFIDEDLFRFIYETESNKVFVQTPTTNLIVDNGECKSNDVFRVCINSANFSHKNITTYEYYYEIDAEIYKLTGSLSTSSKITLSTLLQREPTELTRTITNPTNFDITNIEYNEDFSSFLILEVKGCSLENKKVYWKGTLKPNYEKACTMKMIAEKDGAYNLVGNLKYFNGFETEESTTDSVAVTVLPKQIKISQFIDQDIELKKRFYLNISLENINTIENIDASLTIELPTNLAILKKSIELNQDFNILRHSFRLEPGEIKNYSIYLEAADIGDRPIKLKTDYIIKNIKDAIENYTALGIEEPKPQIDFTSEFYELTPGQKYIVFVKLTNPSRMHELTNLKAQLNVPYNNNITQSLNKLQPNSSYPIISNTLILPKDIEADKTISLNLTVEYKYDSIVKFINESLKLKVVTANQLNVTALNYTQNQSVTTDIVTGDLSNETNASILTNRTISITEFELDENEGYLKNRIFVGIIVFVIVLLVPFIIIKIKGRNKEEQTQQGIQTNEDLSKNEIYNK
ncbi:hypothetical protein HYW99_03410 [Candidatus Woesearchaeota archaeon]|nr:hypothetical protein [Candidatus Woesearchaeota archaeon]